MHISVCNLEDIITKPKIVDVINSDGMVCAMTVLGGQLFVVCYKQSKVDVYNRHDNRYVLFRHIQVADMKNPLDLVSCERNQCLYVSDMTLALIHKINVQNDSCSKWKVNGRPRGLSVTRSSNVLVTLWDVNRIEEYTTDGSLIRQINLDVSIDHPWHCIELPTGQHVVCHQGVKQSRVCIVDTQGRIIHSYDGHQGQSGLQTIIPAYLTVDRDDNVLVVDWSNKRLVLLNSSLTHISTLSSLSPDQRAFRPYRVHFDIQSSLLYVRSYRDIFVLSCK